jgi:hypothetical protein
MLNQLGRNPRRKERMRSRRKSKKSRESEL